MGTTPGAGRRSLSGQGGGQPPQECTTLPYPGWAKPPPTHPRNGKQDNHTRKVAGTCQHETLPVDIPCRGVGAAAPASTGDTALYKVSLKLLPTHPRNGKQDIPIRKPLAISQGKTLPVDIPCRGVGAAAPASTGDTALPKVFLKPPPSHPG